MNGRLYNKRCPLVMFVLTLLTLLMFIISLMTSIIAFAAVVPSGIKLAEKQTLTKGMPTAVYSIDPHNNDGVEWPIIRDLFEGLTAQDAYGQVIPAGATHWENLDNKTYLFYLRRDAKWSNGDPVIADDYVYSFRRMMDPKTNSLYSWFLDIATIVNAKEVLHGRKPPESLGISALDDYLLEIKLDKKVPYFLKMLSHANLIPLHRKSIETYGEQWDSPNNLVNNGAFILESWHKNKVVLSPNRYYWDRKNTVITKVTYVTITNKVEEMNLFLNGAINITSEVPNEYIPKLKKDNADEYVLSPKLCTYFYDINNQKEPFTDRRVRKAISLAIDRDYIVQSVLNNKGDTPTYTFSPQQMVGLKVDLPPEALMTQKQRDQKAIKLLAEAGYSKEKPLKFNLLYNINVNNKNVTEAVMNMLEKTLNAQVTLEMAEWVDYVQLLQQGRYDIARYGWCSDYNEASSILSLWRSDNRLNAVFYNNSKYDDILNKALDANSEKERSELYRQAEAILSRDVPFVPIYSYVTARLIDKKLRGFPIQNPEEVIYSKDLYFIE